MAFTFSQRSINALKGVDPLLQEICKKAITISAIDFSITEGMRTIEKQKEYVRSGSSKTMNSKHLEGRAIDVAALVKRTVSWDIKHYAIIAEAFREASKRTGTPLRWGGAWSCYDIAAQDKTMINLYRDYCLECNAKKQKAFIDGPHFELS